MTSKSNEPPTKNKKQFRFYFEVFSNVLSRVTSVVIQDC